MNQPKPISRRKYGGEELFGLISASIESVLTKYGVSPKVATLAALDASASVRQNLGAATIYIPKGCRPDASETAAEVYARWQGGEHVQDLADQLNFTPCYIYMLIARERNRLKEIRDNQTHCRNKK